ncbi:MAG: alkaline phosphatase family protein [Bacteroidetes bacterium]|nr:alkaline phosphatase family protein [Bacteroidota bacterium]
MRRDLLLGSALLMAAAGAAQSPINGPMPGYSECLETIVWLQCHGPCTAQLEYWKEDRPDSTFRTPPQQGEPDKAYAMDFILDQVVPGTTYAYRVLLDGGALTFEEPLRVHTQPLWKFRTDPPAFTLATGSCAYINEPAYDRPGTPYGGGYAIFNSIADQHPDLMVWLGDNVYLREPDWGSWSGFLHRYSQARALPELQRLLRGTHHYATWDDHDFGPNDGDGSFINADMARRAFDLFWPNPASGAPGVGGITTSFSYADVDVFLLDDRTFRVPPDVVTDSATMLGKAQIDWLVRALKYSDASFKLVALGGQFLNTAKVYETYATYPAERQRIIDRIAREGISGVVFLTGDRHFTELAKLDLPNGKPLYDLTVSPFTSTAYTPKETNGLGIPGTQVAQRNFALLRFSGPKGHRTLTITVHDVDGKPLWEQAIQQDAK